MTAEPRTITIVVLTPALVGTTGIDLLGPDIDVLTDADGLPYIPRRRLAARLRDAAITVAQAFEGEASSALNLLGRGGAVSGRRALVVGHARLPEPTRAAVAGAGRGTAGGTPMPVRVTRACTVEWQSTAVDDLGGPVAGSLRSYRGLAPGLVLTAPLTWQAAATDELVRTLARCSLALGQIGNGDSRDLGRVHCLLFGSWDRTLELAELPAPAAPVAPPVEVVA